MTPEGSSESSGRSTWSDPWFLGLLLGSVACLTLWTISLPPLDADESLQGLTTFKVLRGEFPSWSDELHGRGSLKSYLDAPIVAALGPTTRAVRLGSFCYRVVGIIVVFAILRLMSGGVASLIGACLVGIWQSREGLSLLLGTSSGLTVLLWYLSLLSLALSCRSPRHRDGLAAVTGALTGLSLWNDLQSVLIIVPVIGATLIMSRRSAFLARRSLLLVGGLLVGCLPLVHSALSLGRLIPLERLVSGLQADFKPSRFLSQVLDNTSRFVFQSLSESITIAEGPAGGVLACLLVALVVGLLVRHLGRHNRPTQTSLAPSEEKPEWYFWGCIGVIGILTIASQALVASPEAPLFRPKESLTLFALVPILVADWCHQNIERRPWLVATVILALLLPTAVQLAQIKERFEEKRAAYEAASAIQWQLSNAKATTLLGEMRDVLPFQFWTANEVVSVRLAPGLDVEMGSLPLPRPGPSLLLARRGSELERTLSQLIASTQWIYATLRIASGVSPVPPLGDGVVELDAGEGSRLYLLPQRLHWASALAPLARRVAFIQELGRFSRGEVPEIVLNQALSSGASREGDSLAITFRTTQTAHLAFGPYLPLAAGRYEISYLFELSRGARAEVALDVSSETGSRSLWAKTVQLTDKGGIVRGRFSAPASDSFRYETRALVNEVSGTLKLIRVNLRQLDDEPAIDVPAATTFRRESGQ